MTKKTRKTIKSHPIYIYLKDGTKTANNRPSRFKTVQDAKNYIWEGWIRNGAYTNEFELIFDIYKGDPKICSPSRDYIATIRTGLTVYNHTIDYN
tara:strand:- start:532 stop:816 length:285 start_codon:yes stop_codon:yes gene_type:complete